MLFYLNNDFFQTGFKVDKGFESSVEYSFEPTLSLKWKNFNKFGKNKKNSCFSNLKVKHILI